MEDGIVNQEEVDVVGLNGKMNELQAALGLCVLDQIALELRRRQLIIARYRERLAAVSGLRLTPDAPGVESSCQYFVVRIDESRFGCSRNVLTERLKTYNVLSRKYFYPLCTQYRCYRDLPSSTPGLLPVATEVVEQVLCLPLYGALALEDVDLICDMIIEIQGRG